MVRGDASGGVHGNAERRTSLVPSSPSGAKNVKDVTINISLNPELAEFARSDSEANAFDSMSEYMRDLIRHRRQQRIKQDLALLEKAMEGAHAGDPSENEMAEIVKTQRRIRAQLNRARHS